MTVTITPGQSDKPRGRDNTGPRNSRTGPPAPRFPKIKATHEIVLQALEVANLALKRVATVEEVRRALSRKEVEELEAGYAKSIHQSVSVILNLLIKRGNVFSPGRIGKHSYYGSKNILDPTASPLPDEKSRRRRVLDLVRESVAELKRAVRVGEVLDYAAGRAAYADISPEFITRDILGLVPTKDVILVGTVRGDPKGVNLYLPSGLDPELYMPKGPLTWLESVAHTFNEIWADHKKDAEATNSRPRPVTTGEVRARLRSKPDPHPNLTGPKSVVKALIQLSGTDRPLIRKIGRHEERSVRWIPLEVLDGDVDVGSSYASDIERICEAVDRAVKRLGRPVTVSDVRDEVDRDESLRPAGKSDIANVISEAARETLGVKGSPRRQRVGRRVFRAGSVRDTSYYFNDAGRLAAATSYVNLRRLEQTWSESGIAEDLEGIKLCSLPAVAAGRAMSAVIETGRILKEIDEEIESKRLGGSVMEEALAFRHQVSSILDCAKEKLAFYETADLNLPAEVRPEVPGWTAAELLPIISPLYPAARRLDRTSQLIPLLEGYVRRLPNPEYKNRFVTDPRAAAEHIYDRTDALLYMAITFGGSECRLQARLARNELGLLRDPRFVLPTLRSNDFHDRLVGVSCLAFLWSNERNEHLRRLAAEDPDQGVRQSALWAYCFTGAKDWRGLLRGRAKADPDEAVRYFASNMLMEFSHSGTVWGV